MAGRCWLQSQEKGPVEEAERISERNVVEMVAASVWKEARTWKEDSVDLGNLHSTVSRDCKQRRGEDQG